MFRIGRLCRVQVRREILDGRIRSCRVDEVQHQGMGILNPIRRYSTKELPGDEHIKSPVDKIKTDLSKNGDSDGAKAFLGFMIVVGLFGLGLAFYHALRSLREKSKLESNEFSKLCQEYAKEHPEFYQIIKEKMQKIDEKEREGTLISSSRSNQIVFYDEETLDRVKRDPEETLSLLFYRACLEYSLENQGFMQTLREWNDDFYSDLFRLYVYSKLRPDDFSKLCQEYAKEHPEFIQIIKEKIEEKKREKTLKSSSRSSQIEVYNKETLDRVKRDPNETLSFLEKENRVLFFRACLEYILENQGFMQTIRELDENFPVGVKV